MKPETKTRIPDPGKIALSVAEAAAACGLSTRTLRQYIRDGELPAARIGARVLVLRKDLESWIAGRTDRSGALVRPDRSGPLGRRNREGRERRHDDKEEAHG